MLIDENARYYYFSSLVSRSMFVHNGLNMLHTVFIITIFSTYKCSKLKNAIFIFTINCGMCYKPMLGFRASFLT